MTTLERIQERACFYGISCQAFLDDIAFMFEERNGREGVRKNQVLEILKESREGISTADIANKLNLSKPNIASVLMELRKNGVKILNINGLMVLADYVNIG